MMPAFPLRLPPAVPLLRLRTTARTATAVGVHAFEALRLPRLLAITSPHNTRSIHLLEKIGLRFERMITPPGETSEIRLYTSDR